MQTVFPIITPNLDLPMLNALAEQVTGNKVTAETDRAKLADGAKIVSALSFGDFNEALISCDPVIKKAAYTFAVVLDESTLLRVCSIGQVEVSFFDAKKRGYFLAYISGHLISFQQFIFSSSHFEETIQLSTELFRYFCKIGLSSLFTKYNQRPTARGLLTLEEK